MNLFNNLSIIKDGGIELLFYSTSIIILLDFVSIVYFGERMEVVKDFSVIHIAIFGVIYLIVFHLAKLLRATVLLIKSYFTFLFKTYAFDKNYYTINELLNEAVNENSSTKLAVYRDCKAKQEKEININNLYFLNAVLFFMSSAYPNSLIRVLFLHKSLVFFSILLILLLIKLTLRDDPFDGKTNVKKIKNDVSN